jgi:hypothetical protein
MVRLRILHFFFSDSKKAPKISYFFNYFGILLTRHLPQFLKFYYVFFIITFEGTFTSFSKIISHTEVTKPVLRMCMFLGPLDQDPDPLVRGMDPDPHQCPGSAQNSRINVFLTIFA